MVNPIDMVNPNAMVNLMDMDNPMDLVTSLMGTVNLIDMDIDLNPTVMVNRMAMDNNLTDMANLKVMVDHTVTATLVTNIKDMDTNTTTTTSTIPMEKLNMWPRSKTTTATKN